MERAADAHVLYAQASDAFMAYVHLQYVGDVAGAADAYREWVRLREDAERVLLARAVTA